MLLAADDYSAVSGRVPLSNLYERGRSLGIGVQVSAQSWQGLGATEDERYRIAATADGGIFVLHTPYPEPLTQLAGTRRVLETAHKLVGNSWGDEGTTREQRAWTADPDLIRRLDVGPGVLHPPRRGHLRPGRPPQTLPAHPAPATTRRAAARGQYPRPARRLPRHRGRPRTPLTWGISSALEPPDEPRPVHPNPFVPNPFAILGLPEWPDLDDETVHAAWHAIAAETHPDRPDGGNLARYTQATAAYFELSLPLGPLRGLRRPARSGLGRRPLRRLPRPPPARLRPRRPRRRLAAAARARGMIELGPVPLDEMLHQASRDPGPVPPRPPVAPADPRRGHRRAVPGRAHRVPRPFRGRLRRRGADRVLRAVRRPGRHRAPRPGRSAGCRRPGRPDASGGASGSRMAPRSRTRLRARSWLGSGGLSIPFPPAPGVWHAARLHSRSFFQ